MTGDQGRGLLWLVPAAAAAVMTAMVLFVLPPDRVLHNLADFVLKVSPVVFAVIAIALFPQSQKDIWAPLLVLVGSAFFLGAIDSSSFIQVSQLVDAAQTDHAQAQFAVYYRFTTFVDAFVVLFGLLAYRLGGGSTRTVLRLGAASVLLLVSGLNDLTMWAMYAWPGGVRPDAFSWASHVAVFIGRTPLLSDMVYFVAIHLCLALGIVVVPLLARPPSRGPGGFAKNGRPAHYTG